MFLLLENISAKSRDEVCRDGLFVCMFGCVSVCVFKMWGPFFTTACNSC